jgi:hypothetical protein
MVLLHLSIPFAAVSPVFTHLLLAPSPSPTVVGVLVSSHSPHPAQCPWRLTWITSVPLSSAFPLGLTSEEHKLNGWLGYLLNLCLPWAPPWLSSSFTYKMTVSVQLAISAFQDSPLQAQGGNSPVSAFHCWDKIPEINEHKRRKGLLWITISVVSLHSNLAW